RRDESLAFLALRPHDAVQAEQQCGQLRGRVGVHEIAHDGAAIADRGMRHRGKDFLEERGPRPRPALEIPLARQSAHGERASALPEPAQLAAVIDIHERGRPGKPKSQHGEEALAAGKDFGLVSVSTERRHGVGGILRHHVVERSRLHVVFAASMSPTTTDGPSGVRVTRTLTGASASSTALAMAAGGEMAPPSPMPLMPKGLRGEGYSRCTVSMAGSSIAVGTRESMKVPVRS